VDTRIGRAVVGAAALIAVVAGVDLVRAQPQDQPPPAAAQDAGPPPPLPPAVMSPADQKPAEPARAPEPGPSTGSGALQGPVSMGPIVQAPPPIQPPEQKPAAALEPPPGPPKPVRSQIAVLQVLDKVTAETLRFIAPVGRPVRYKTLVFTVRACETRNLDAPQPQPSAYLLIESRAGVAQGDGAGPKAVFKGWIFANAPDVHPFEHPVYDAWLVACSASPPPA
jgi:hypothetical protein